MAHRKKSSEEYIDYLIKKGVEGDFLNKGIMQKIADEVYDFLFMKYEPNNFDEMYDKLIENAKEAENEYLEDEINDGMAFLPSKVDFDPWAS
ncbi:hypothetical protein P4576_17000 [Peribacillus frigoritolerans]|uniref:hypothetical protein n=1 Tax=Peribacillus frigoritolerans TaxID=450367 RepID=UPI002E2206EB|nr:hypothetical protein [Peribacillus frigoritolerans]